MPTIVCPHCNKDDLIQKVSAVVTSGTSSGSFSGASSGVVSIDGKSGSTTGFSSLSGSSTTNLARLLVAPTEPSKPGGVRWFLIILAVGVTYVLSAIPTAIIFFVLGMIGLYEEKAGTDNVVLFVFAIIFVVAAYFLINRLVPREKKRAIDNQVTYEREKKRWDSAIPTWNRLYYCHRNGIVFDPETGKTCEPANIKNFIYEQS